MGYHWTYSGRTCQFTYQGVEYYGDESGQTHLVHPLPTVNVKSTDPYKWMYFKSPISYKARAGNNLVHVGVGGALGLNQVIADVVKDLLIQMGKDALVVAGRMSVYMTVLTLKGDAGPYHEKKSKNPVMPGPWTTSRGLPWNNDVKGHDNSNYPSEPPKWIWPIIYGTAAYQIYDNWQKPNILQPSGNPVIIQKKT